MSMTHSQIARLLDELTPRIVPGRVRKVYQPEGRLLQIELFSGGATVFLTVRTEVGANGLYAADKRLGPSGQEHPEFCNKLRHDLAGLSLVRVSQVPEERIVHLDFSDGEHPDMDRSLVLELFSSASNCFLLDSAGTVLSLMHPSLSRKRRNFPGHPFSPPTAGNPSAASHEADPAAGIQKACGLPDYNSAVRAWLEETAAGLALEREKQEVLRALVRETQRLEKLVQTHERTIEEAKRAAWHRECGEILAANFRSLRRGQDKARLPDLFRSDNLRLREIPLEPKLTPQDNLQRYFKRARKLLSGAEFARERLPVLAARIDSLKSSSMRIENLSDPQAVRSELTGTGLSSSARKVKKAAAQKATEEPRLPYREFTAGDGSAILVGRKGKDNDQLTFRVARGRDLWFHISGAAGAHVVLRCDNAGSFTDQALLDAAHLAVFYSSLKEEPAADVDYTLCKHLSKPKGLPPGKVTLSERKTIHVRIERPRLDRLLGRESFHAPD